MAPEAVSKQQLAHTLMQGSVDMKRPISYVLLLLSMVAFLSFSVVAADTKLVFATYASGLGTPEIWGNLIAQFTAANPDIEVEVQVYPFGDYVDKIVTMIAGGTPPDVFQTWAQYKPRWIEMGLLRDVTDEWERSTVLRDSEFYPFMLDAAKYNDRFYGIPYDFNSVVWFHNLDWLQERGVEPPTNDWTVQDLREMSRKLVDPERQIYASTNPAASASGLSIQWMVNWSGHEWLSADRTQVMVANAANIEMLEFWRDMRDNLHTVPYPGGFAARGTFNQGGYAMAEEYLSGVFVSEQQATFDWGISLLPKAPSGQYSFAQAHMFSIAESSRQHEAAWRLLEWLASYEGQKAILGTTVRQPVGPYMDLWEEFFARLSPDRAVPVREWLTEVLYGQNYARNFNYWETYPEMERIMAHHLSRVFNEGAHIGNEMQMAADRLRAILTEQ